MHGPIAIAMEYEQIMGIAIIFRKGFLIIVLVSALYEFGRLFWVAMLLDPFISAKPSQTKKGFSRLLF